MLSLIRSSRPQHPAVFQRAPQGVFKGRHRAERLCLHGGISDVGAPPEVPDHRAVAYGGCYESCCAIQRPFQGRWIEHVPSNDFDAQVTQRTWISTVASKRPHRLAARKQCTDHFLPEKTCCTYDEYGCAHELKVLPCYAAGHLVGWGRMFDAHESPSTT